MKNVLLGAALLIFLLVGSVSALVINDPVAMANMVSMAPEAPDPKPRPVTPKTSTESSRQVADAATSDTTRKAPPPRDTKTPPKRSDSADEETAASSVPFSRKARYVGPATQLPPGRAPRTDYYPLSAVRRSEPDIRTVNVEIAVANKSGTHWKTAYVALRSTRMDEAQLYEISDWGLDEVVGFDYLVPKNEINDRLHKLRVISVTGEQRESALANLLARSRQQYISMLSAEGDENFVSLRQGDQLSAPGLLALVGALQAPFTGISIDVVRPTVTKRSPVRITIPKELLIEATLRLDSRGTSEDLRTVRELAEVFHSNSLEVQRSLEALISILGRSRFEEAMAAGGSEAVANVRQAVQKFNASGIVLSQTIQRSRDSEVRSLNMMGTVVDYSKKIKGQLDLVESGIQVQDRSFKFQ